MIYFYDIKIAYPVLVTGGVGYVGSITVAELNRHTTPVIVDNLSTRNREAVRTDCFHVGDIVDFHLHSSGWLLPEGTKGSKGSRRKVAFLC